jgi:hypothetical protein
VEAHQIGDVRTAPRILAVSVPALLPQRLVSAAREVATAVGEGGAEVIAEKRGGRRSTGAGCCPGFGRGVFFFPARQSRSVGLPKAGVAFLTRRLCNLWLGRKSPTIASHTEGGEW